MECLWNNCKQNFNTPEELREHLETHDFSELKCFWADCPRLNEIQPNKYALSAHVKKHSGDRPFKCKVCPKTYTRGDALSKHMKHHKQTDKEVEECINIIFYLKEQITILERKKEISEKNKILSFDRLKICSKNFIEIIKEELKLKMKQEIFGKESFWDNFLYK